MPQEFRQMVRFPLLSSFFLYKSNALQQLFERNLRFLLSFSIMYVKYMNICYVFMLDSTEEDATNDILEKQIAISESMLFDTLSVKRNLSCFL